MRFLDWKITMTNQLLHCKEMQINVLRELERAIIDEAILHGFHRKPQVDSGVHWLGKIPFDWCITALKHICGVNASISEVMKTMQPSDQVTFLPMENVSETGHVDCTIKRSLKDVCSGYSSFQRGDVIVAKITPCFENGKGACLEQLDTEVGFGTTEFINLRPSKDVLPQYLYMITMTRMFRMLGEQSMTGSAGQKRVPVEFIKNFMVGIPSVKEQKNILEKLEAKTTKIHKQIDVIQMECESIRELKIRLISDVVTGKLDVRNIKIPAHAKEA